MSVTDAPLRVAVVKDGEPLPQMCAPWTLRTGNLCRELAGRGHNVTWYGSTFMHNEKEFYALEETLEEREEGYHLHLLHVGGYRRNVSWARWLHHSRLGRAVYQELLRSRPPDVVVCCVPILELALFCSIYCHRRGIPLILDIQDPWPRNFVDYAPPWLKPFVRAALTPYFLGSGRIFRRATSLVACSHGFLSWAQGLARRSERGSARDRVVYHGAHHIGEDIEPDPVVPTQGLRSIYMGAFGKIYDLDALASLMEAQAERGDDHHLFLVGWQANDARFLLLRQRLEKLPNVTFTGWLPREKVYALAQTCHLGWLPLAAGTEDFLPNKPFEYAALGMAVATSSLGESGRLVEHNGLGFCYGGMTTEELLAKVGPLAPGQATLEAWRARSPEFFRRQGDARVCAGQFADHIERITAERRRAQGGAG